MSLELELALRETTPTEDPLEDVRGSRSRSGCENVQLFLLQAVPKRQGLEVEILESWEALRGYFEGLSMENVPLDELEGWL